MRLETSREFAVPLEMGWAYLSRPRSLVDWRAGMLELQDPETARWAEAGDRLRMAFRLLGRRLEGECILDEMRANELARFTVRVPGLPVLHETWEYTPAGEQGFLVHVIQESEPPASFFGRAIDNTLLPRVVLRDLERSLDTVADIFAAGLHEEVTVGA